MKARLVSAVPSTPSPEARAAVLAELERVAAGLPREELPGFLGEIESVRIRLVLAAQSGSAENGTDGDQARGDRLLSVDEVAAKLGRSKWWVYRNRSALPIVRLPTGGYGFSESAVDRWIRRRSG